MVSTRQAITLMCVGFIATGSAWAQQKRAAGVNPPPPATTPGQSPVNPGQLPPVVSPGQAPAGMVNPGRGDPALRVSPAQTGVVNPGTLDPRMVRPGQDGTRLQDPAPGYVVPGQGDVPVVNPGQSDGRMVSPGRGDARSVRPGLSDERLTSPGQVYGEVVSAGQGVPIFTVHPGLDAAPASGLMQTHQMSSVNQRISKPTSQQIAQRLVVLRSLPMQEQNVELTKLIHEMDGAPAEAAATAATSEMAVPSVNTTSAAAPATRSVWVTGTRLSRSGEPATEGIRAPSTPVSDSPRR